MWGSRSDKLMDQIFNLKFTSKQMVRSSKKSESEYNAELGKVKVAIQKGNLEGARIHSQNAIRKKNEGLNYLRLSSRLDAVASNLETQSKMQGVSRSMAGIVKALDRSLKENNLEKAATTMDQFEKQFLTMGIQSDFMEGAMSNQTALSTPQDQVDDLMTQVAASHNLDLKQCLPDAAIGTKEKEQEQGTGEDLFTRLRDLSDKQ